MLDRMLDQNELPSLQDISEAKKAPQTPTLLQQIGRHRLVQPIVRGAGALMMLATTACTGAEAAGLQAQVSTHPSKPKTEQVFKDRVDHSPLNILRNPQRPAQQRSAQQAFDFQSITRMDAPTWAARCATKAMTNPINGFSSVPMTDVLLLGRMYIFNDRPEYEQEALDNDYHGIMDAYLASAADFWRHFYGIQITHRTQRDFVRPGNFWGPDGKAIYPKVENLADRGLQVAPVQADRPGQYVVPFDIYVVDASYSYVTGRPLGAHGQVIFSKRPLVNGINASDAEDVDHEIGHTFGQTHQDRNPHNVMHSVSSVLPLEVDIDTVNENCPAQTGPTPTPTATPRPPGAFRVLVPAAPRD